MSNSPTFPLAFDHVSLLVSEQAPEAQTLVTLGLHDSGRTVDQGSVGLASRFFYFQNSYLELFWVRDPAVAEASLDPVGVNVRARQSWRNTGASPFGLMFRRHQPDLAALPFPTRQLRVQRMAHDIAFEFNAERLNEPYYAVVPQALAFKANSVVPAHPLGLQTLTQVKLVVQGQALSAPAQLLVSQHLVTMELGEAPVLELTFDAGRQTSRIDVRPVLPLILNY